MKKNYLLLIVLLLMLNLNAQITKTFYLSGKLESIGTMVNGVKSGVWKWYYENGQLSILGTYNNGKEGGVWKWYHTNGLVWAIGYFSSGQSIGVWKRFSSNGKPLSIEGLQSNTSSLPSQDYFKYSNYLYFPISIGFHKNGIRDGEWKDFSSDGKITFRCWYKNGKMDGPSSNREDFGEIPLTAVGNYQNGKREGEWNWFNPQGKLMKKMVFKNDKAHGVWKEFQQDGDKVSSGAYLNDKKHDFWNVYNKDGYYLFKGNYINGKLNGECIWYKSEKEITARGFYNEGILTTKFETFYPNGEIEEIGSVINKSVIDWKLYYQNSVLKEQGKTINGFKEGEWKEFYENGKLKSAGTYKNGIEVGQWTYYYENGNLWKTGNRLSYDEDGEWQFYHEKGGLDSTAFFIADTSLDPNAIIKGHLSEGLMSYAKGNKIGFMDSTGNIILSHENGFDYVGRLPFFKEGKCMFFKRNLDPLSPFNSIYVSDSRGDEVNFGFIDKNFNVVIPADFPYSGTTCNGFVASFSQGNSIVRVPNDFWYNYNYIIIDSMGQYVNGPFTYSGGCYAACTYYPVLNDGIFVIDGIARTSGYTTNYNFLDVKSGRLFTIENCTLAGPFSEGVAAVEINYEYITLVDRSGNPIINKKFYTIRRGSGNVSDYHPGNGCDRIGGFRNGKMLIHHFENEGYGKEVLSLIDKKGNVLLQKVVDQNVYELYQDKDFEKYRYQFDCDF